MPVLEMTGVRASYDGVQALHGMDLEIAEGEMVALLGANGAGKTTSLRAISGTVQVTGQVRFAGQDVAGWAPHRVARLGVGHVPEGRGTFVDLTVAENLTLGALARPKALRDRVDADLDVVHQLFPVLREFAARRAGALSGGQQQMLAIARAMLGRPRLLLVDEPSLGLAPMVTTEILRALRRLQGEWELSVLLAEQNARRALKVVDRAYVLESGRVVASGSAAQLQQDSTIQDAYLGAEIGGAA
ncbi:MAG TPA: ABC transporter ATP-binding protein [Mycobacteriales bacterium]|nr:ABC transporter ATP-binding protein [Mycobacteriales bacterium]